MNNIRPKIAPNIGDIITLALTPDCLLYGVIIINKKTMITVGNETWIKFTGCFDGEDYKFSANHIVEILG